MRRGKNTTVLSIFIVVFIVTAMLLKNCYSATYLDNLNKRQIIPWGLKKINVLSISSEVTGKGVKVAIMDSGINKHPDFGYNIKEGYNAINRDDPVFDDYGHGTLVSGVIVAQNNDFGIVGVAPDVELYPVKVLDEFGEGEISDIVKGIDWCIENNIQVINMSFAIEEDNPLLHEYVKKAFDSGIIIVASGSNTYGGDVGYPASYEQVISVTAVDKRLNISNSSPKGKIDFSAPGVDVISTTNDGGYEEFTGTSIAAAYVTGIIALILEKPEKFGLTDKYSFNDVYLVLEKLSQNLGDRCLYGHGFISLK